MTAAVLRDTIKVTPIMNTWNLKIPKFSFLDSPVLPIPATKGDVTVCLSETLGCQSRGRMRSWHVVYIIMYHPVKTPIINENGLTLK